MRKSEWLKGGLVAVLALCLAAPALAEDLARVDIGASAVQWDVQGDFEQTVLTISLPNGNVIRREIKAGQPVVFQLDGAAKDGVYGYELRGTPRFDASVRKELDAARRSGNELEVIERLKEAGRIPREGAMQSGVFTVKDGSLVAPDLQETGRVAARPSTEGKIQIITGADQVIPDDLIVQGSGCFGFDCVNNESFGFDTIRLKENNLRIKFEDTSTGTFPANDWQITANDSASGGSNKLSIEDITGSRVPFTITAGAATNSIFVDSTGRLGLRTSTPVLDLHVNTSNTPAIRLEQNNSGGFTAQTWDIGANEANFFVRDVTGGSKLSFRIRPGAPTSSIDISADGDVGIGTASPDVKLHIRDSDGATKFTVEEDSATVTNRELFELRNNGGATFTFTNKSTVQRWGVGMNGTNFLIDNQGNAGTEFTLGPTGNLTITGIYSPSDRNLKKDIVPVRRSELLAKLAAVPISTWTYKTDDILHMGPMAQDFSAAFGLGINDTTVSPMDMAGVSMAAAQALNEELREKNKEIADLKSRLDSLEKLVQSLAEAKGAAPAN
jgi:Chaperone of endosialidase